VVVLLVVVLLVVVLVLVLLVLLLLVVVVVLLLLLLHRVNYSQYNRLQSIERSTNSSTDDCTDHPLNQHTHIPVPVIYTQNSIHPTH
jgi:hypothetical protein